MLLRERAVAVFLADWTDKASDIQHIAKTLNIGLGALALLVLGRRVEEAALAAVARAARAAGANRLIGEYFPTAKNQMVREQFAKLGFVKDGPAGEEGTRWVLDLGSYHAPDLPMRIQVHCPVGSVADMASVTGQANA